MVIFLAGRCRQSLWERFHLLNTRQKLTGKKVSCYSALAFLPSWDADEKYGGAAAIKRCEAARLRTKAYKTLMELDQTHGKRRVTLAILIPSVLGMD